ncbi:hypothetical protein [Streptomyces sp. NPDC008125]|uniref:DUF7847 domain-containing protein n=1 Tax=Streptomyces sp. NPDC008125 TaxID=3364811 RepID=UPI0036E084A9
MIEHEAVEQPNNSTGETMSQDAGWGGAAQGGAPHGWGAPQGWGGRRMPPPPEPGVIPLAPLQLSNIFNGAFSTMGRYWKALFGFTAAVYGAAAVAFAATLLIAFSAVHDHIDSLQASSEETDVPWDDITPVLVALGIVLLIGVVVFVLALALVQAAAPAVLQGAVLGRPVTFRAVRETAVSRLRAMLGTVFLTGLIGVVPVVLAVGFEASLVALVVSDGDSDNAAAFLGISVLLLLVAGPLASWLWVKFSLAPTAVVLERQGPIAAMRRSSRLVRGSWWRILGISLLGQMVAGMASSVIQIPFSAVALFSSALTTPNMDSDTTLTTVLISMAGIVAIALAGQLIGQIFVSTFPPLILGLLYIDRRMRTENLAQDLATAAGLPPQPAYAPPQYGHQAPEPGQALYGHPGRQPGDTPQAAPAPHPGPAPQPGTAPRPGSGPGQDGNSAP